jgi:hypothetical protein
MWAFASRKPQPLAYARSYLSNFIFSGNNEVFEHLLREDLRGLVFPEDQVLDPVNWTIDAPRNPMMPKDKRLEMASLMDEFTNRAIQVSCLTSVFIRRYFCILELMYVGLRTIMNSGQLSAKTAAGCAVCSAKVY